MLGEIGISPNVGPSQPSCLRPDDPLMGLGKDSEAFCEALFHEIIDFNVCSVIEV